MARKRNAVLRQFVLDRIGQQRGEKFAQRSLQYRIECIGDGARNLAVDEVEDGTEINVKPRDVNIHLDVSQAHPRQRQLNGINFEGRAAIAIVSEDDAE